MSIYQPIPQPLEKTREATKLVVSVQVAAPEERPTLRGNGSTAHSTTAPLREHRQFTLSPWPTSQPGPHITAPSPGQRLVANRTDQVTYDTYDQERGRPGLSSPLPADQARASTTGSLETRQATPTVSRSPVQPLEPTPLHEQVRVGLRVYDTQGKQIGKIAVRFPLYLLIERGRIFPRVYYVPLALVARINGPSLWLSVSEATLKAQDCAQVPLAINDAPASPANEHLLDISGVSSLGLSPLTPAETGHYHYGPHSPGMNTDAGGSYTPAEIDPRGRLRDRPVKLYITGKRLSSRSNERETPPCRRLSPGWRDHVRRSGVNDREP